MGGQRFHGSNVWAVRAGVLSILAILLVSARSALGDGVELLLHAGGVRLVDEVAERDLQQPA
ncbi:MAG: hypothetical protein EPN53_00940, partial [Acidobacteria bacterium]